MRIGAILMASGSGKRFGGDKLFARIGDQTLIEKTLHAVPEEVFEKTAVIAKDERILLAARQYGFVSVRNDRAEEGISGSIRLGTEEMRDLDAAMYLVCDQPYLTKETIRELVKTAEEHPERIIVPESNGRWGNPCIFPKNYFPELMKLQGDTGGKAVIRQNPEAVLTVAVPEEELLDIDKKEDLPEKRT